MQKCNSDDTLSDSSVKLPQRTGDYDKDIPPSPNLPNVSQDNTLGSQ